MSNAFSANLQRLIESHMSGGAYPSEEALRLDALAALAEIEARGNDLRAELSRRLTDGLADAQLLDRDAFKSAARRRREAAD